MTRASVSRVPSLLAPIPSSPRPSEPEFHPRLDLLPVQVSQSLRMNLHGVSMYVSSTAHNGVIDSDTRIHFTQKGSRVLGRYRGGSITRGYLVGEVRDASLVFRYTQSESTGEIHGGRSVCELTTAPDGRLRIVERFRWRTRQGSGVNTFDQVSPEKRPSDQPG